jgi:hypothetical protein
MLAIHQPYPFFYNKSGLQKQVAVYFGIIFFFLWFFEPFHVNPDEQKVSYILICFLHALSPTLIFLIYFLVLSLALSEKQIEKWTVGKEILHLCVLFFLFGVASFLMRDVIYTNPDNWSWHYFFEEVKNTFLGGSLLSAFLILLNFYRLKEKTQKKAEQIDYLLPVQVIEELKDEVAIQTQVKADDFELRLSEFLFAQAAGNYVEVFCLNGSGVKKELKRITLSQLEMRLRSFVFILRCHRAYLINTQHIQHVTGNAQGYWLSFSGVNDKIPVSRGKISSFDKLMDRS